MTHAAQPAHETPVTADHELRNWRGVPWNVVLLLVISAIALGFLAIAAIVSQESWTRSTWDSHLLLANAERMHRLGGTYYTTTAEQKGPLWQLLFDVALGITSRRDVWFVIASMIVAVGALTGAAVAGLLRAARIPTWAAVTFGIATMVYLWFGDEEWSRALYSRNIVILLATTSMALVVAGARAPSRRRLLAALVAGALMGLAAQTNPGSTLTAAIVLVALVLLARTPGPHRAPARSLAGVSIAFIAAFVIALASAPVLYLWLGVFDDFWAQWWTYNMFYTEATGRTFAGILVKGTVDFVGYYTSRPLLGFAALLYCIVYVLALPRLSGWDKRLGVLLIIWWLAEVTAVVFSQRFFPHYLVLPFLPVALMAGAMFGKLAGWLDGRPTFRPFWAESRYAIASLVILFILALNGPRVSEAAGKALTFRGFEAAAAARDAALSPTETRLRQAVDEWSDPDDYVVAWTNWPYVWDVMQRTSATRYVDKKWLTGEVFGGGTSPDWVLPGTWPNWIDDMAETSPELIVTFATEPPPADAPVAQLIACGYRNVYQDETQTVYKAGGRTLDCLREMDPER